MSPKIIIISVGGSLIVPDKIDLVFLKNLKNLILRYTKRGFRFVIICGGGRTARTYQEAARALTDPTSEDIDWLGIHGTRINAHLLRAIFSESAYPRIIKNPREKIEFKESVLIAAGWKPGFSTDYDAVLLAKNLGAKKIVNLTNIDYVYDKDPSKFRNAKPIKKISWKDFRAMIPETWDPGLHSPFDPIASREAEKLGLEVAIINGKKLENLEKYLASTSFIGTKIY